MKTTTATLFDLLQAPEAKGLRAADKLVLLYLAWRQGSNGRSWPSLQTIEQDLRINRKTRRRAIEHLCQVGCIRKTSGKCGRGHPNRYEIVVAEKGGACIPISSPEKGTTCIPISETEKGMIRPHKRGHVHTLNIQEQKRQPAGSAFIPPTSAQVDEYAASIGYDRPNLGRDFVDKYAALDWRLKGGERMQNWKLVVQSWRRQDEQHPRPVTPTPAHREPQRGDPDWLPTEEEAVAVLRECGAEVLE